MSAAALRGLLEAGDAAGVVGLWAAINPHLPAPDDAETAMHMARTAAESVTFRKRAYSHRWLTERLLPSQLPDNLKPKAERLYPVVASAVCISVNSSLPQLKPAMVEVRQAMEYAVLDAHAQGRIEDTPFVRTRMGESRDRALKQLFGRYERN